MTEINKKALSHLAELSRMELKPKEEEKLLSDLESILNYFEELKGVNTDSVAPMAGGTDARNVLREDEVGEKDDTGKGSESFPDKQGGYLKIPPIF